MRRRDVRDRRRLYAGRTIGQPDAGSLSGGAITLGAASGRRGGAAPRRPVYVPLASGEEGGVLSLSCARANTRPAISDQ